MHDELNIKQIISLLNKSKRNLAILTIIVGLLATLVNFFLLTPTYVANSLVSIIHDKDTATNKPDINAFIEQVKSPSSINNLISKLNLSYSSGDLISRLEITSVPNSSYIRISIIEQNPAVAKKIVDLIAYQLASNIEVTKRLEMNIEYQKKLTESQNALKVIQSGLDRAILQLKDTPDKLTTVKSLADSPYLQSVVSDSVGSNNKELGALQLNSEEINPVYITLKNEIAESSINLDKTKMEVTNLEDNLKENQEIIKGLELQGLNIDELDSIIQSGAKFNSVMITPSYEPSSPVSPSKIFNILLTCLIFMLLSSCFIIIRHFWKQVK